MGSAASAITSRNIFNQELTIDELGQSDETQTRDKCKFNCELMVSISCGIFLLAFFIFMYVYDTGMFEKMNLKITILAIIILCFVTTLIIAGIILASKRNKKPTNVNHVNEQFQTRF